MPQKLNYKRGDVVLVLFPHSSLREAKTRPALVVQADDLASGLPQVVMTDNLATIVEGAVYRVIGSLPMINVDVALRHTLGI